MPDKTRRARSARACPGPVLAAIAAATLLAPSLAAQTAYRLGPPADWVRPVAPDLAAPTPSGRVTEGFEMLLLDRQEIVRAPAVERFRHVVYRLLDEGAVQAHSQIELTFDSSYEQLTLHMATVIRNGRPINQLRRDRIRVVQREARLDYQIYDGSLSLVLLLEDVRRGDVVEYSYTRRGSNPVFGGHYMGAVALEEAVPLHRVRFRLLWPRDRRLVVARHATSLEPSLHEAGPYREYVWEQAGVPPKVLDADLPSWYDPFAELQLSDFASWSRVAAWGESLFVAPGPVPAALHAPLAQIRSASASTPGRVLRALRFVQDEVRYLGVEIGVNSHVPYPPAIVQAEVDGRDYWLDPTAMYERGDLPSVSPPFGAALVLDGSRDSVSAIPPPPDPGPLTDVAVFFELGDVGTPATMRVDTRYRGAVADNQRASMRSTSIDELQHRYEDFYSARYPGVRSEVPPEIHDDETANEVRTIERYSVPDFWHLSSQQEGYVGTFDPLELAHAVPAATAARRTMPLAVTPRHIRYTIEARLKQGWFITPREETIETPAVRFTYRSRSRGDTLRLAYEYETLADHVAPRAQWARRVVGSGGPGRDRLAGAARRGVFENGTELYRVFLGPTHHPGRGPLSPLARPPPVVRARREPRPDRFRHPAGILVLPPQAHVSLAVRHLRRRAPARPCDRWPARQHDPRPRRPRGRGAGGEVERRVLDPRLGMVRPAVQARGKHLRELRRRGRPVSGVV